jgi:nickel/cobalt exporter
MATTTYALITTAAATALLHTLIPDHWLPFVLIGRARGWSPATVALASGLAATIHAGLSVLLGVIALWIGLATVEVVGETLHRVGGLLLVAFGVGYALWAWTKGGHFHPGGSLLHPADPGERCDGEEGPGHPEHLHYHADDGMIGGRGGWGAIGLAVIVGLNPCVLVLPIMLAGVSRGPTTVALVAMAYALPSALLMVGLSVIGVTVGWRVRLPGVARYAELGSGVLIALLGVLFWVLDG